MRTTTYRFHQEPSPGRHARQPRIFASRPDKTADFAAVLQSHHRGLTWLRHDHSRKEGDGSLALPHLHPRLGVPSLTSGQRRAISSSFTAPMIPERGNPSWWRHEHLPVHGAPLFPGQPEARLSSHQAQTRRKRNAGQVGFLVAGIICDLRPSLPWGEWRRADAGWCTRLVA